MTVELQRRIDEAGADKSAVFGGIFKALQQMMPKQAMDSGSHTNAYDLAIAQLNSQKEQEAKDEENAQRLAYQLSGRAQAVNEHLKAAAPLRPDPVGGPKTKASDIKVEFPQGKENYLKKYGPKTPTPVHQPKVVPKGGATGSPTPVPKTPVHPNGTPTPTDGRPDNSRFSILKSVMSNAGKAPIGGQSKAPAPQESKTPTLMRKDPGKIQNAAEAAAFLNRNEEQLRRAGGNQQEFDRLSRLSDQVIAGATKGGYGSRLGISGGLWKATK